MAPLTRTSPSTTTQDRLAAAHARGAAAAAVVVLLESDSQGRLGSSATSRAAPAPFKGTHERVGWGKRTKGAVDTREMEDTDGEEQRQGPASPSPQAEAEGEGASAAAGADTDAAPLLPKKRNPRQRDLYTALNLDEGASTEEVRASYLRLAALVHPDKHSTNSALRADAEQQFVRIDRAYKVLTDPLMRQAYDLYGERGLRLLQAVPQHELLPLRFPVEVSYLLEEMSAEELQYMGLNAQASSGTVTLAMAVPRPLGLPRMQQLVVDQQVEVPITGQTSLFGALYLANRKAMGVGMGWLGARVHLAKGTLVSATCVVGPKPKYVLETHREFSRSMQMRASLAAAEDGGMNLKVASTRRLTPTVSGTVEMAAGEGAGEEEALAFTVAKSTGKAELSARLRLSTSDVAVKGSYENRISHKLQVRCVGKVGMRGFECAVAGTRNLSHMVGFEFGLAVAPDGVTVSVKARKGRQHVHVPIKLSPAFDPWSLLLGSLVAAGMNATLDLVKRPFEKAHFQRQLRLEEKRALERQAPARRNAAAQVRLMVETARRKAAAERASGGLVILEARYGTTLPQQQQPAPRQPPAEAGGRPDPEWFLAGRDGDKRLDMAPALDVRVPLQFFVSKSRLYLPPGSKAGVLGFYDIGSNPTWLQSSAPDDDGNGKGNGEEEAVPLVNTKVAGAMGLAESKRRRRPPFKAPIRPPHHRQPQRPERPRLYVRYSYRGRVYEVTIDDVQPLELPPLDGEHTELGPEGVVA